MDSLSEIVKNAINYYAAIDPGHEIEVETIYDDTKGHYQMLYMGWQRVKRIHGIVLHLDIRDGKVWIQHDGTGDGIALDLMEAGVPAEQIVLGFRAPDERVHDMFANG